MEDIFKPKSLTIKQLLGDTDALYQIPRYQRPYSWGDDQLEKLWDDIIEAYQSGENYFLGSIITAKPEEKSNYLDVVDGQQRLTTLVIMLCVYRDMFPNLNSDIAEDPETVGADTVKTSIKVNNKLERLRLKTHSNHETDFHATVLNDGRAVMNHKPYKKDLRKEEAPKYKFENTSTFFREKLEELDEKEAGLLINYIFNKVKIIRIDCHSVSFAIKLFQVLNARGLDLSNADLIKSFLIGNIHKKYESDADLKKQKEDQFMDDWKYCEQVAIDTEESMNELFVMYEYYLLADNPKRSLYEELIALFRDQDSNKLLSDFKLFVTRYKQEVYDRHDSLMYSFWYIKWTMYWKTIVITALHSEYPEYEEFLKMFRRYYYINWIAGNTLSKIKNTSFNIIKWLKEAKPLAFIRKELEKSLRDQSNNTMNRAIDNLNYDIYNEAWCKPLLFLIEYNQQDNPKYLPLGDKSIHVEHIVPVKYAKNKDWRYCEQIKGLEPWINSAGNLTLLSGSKNIDASNNGLHEKIKAYDGRGLYRKDDDKITSFVITQKIVNDYKQGRYGKSWTEESINDRWKWFCDEVETILELDLAENRKNILKPLQTNIESVDQHD